MTSLKGTVILGVVALVAMTVMYFFLLKASKSLPPIVDGPAVRELVVKTGAPAWVAIRSPQVDVLREGLVREAKSGRLKIGLKVPADVAKVELRIVAAGQGTWADVAAELGDQPIEVKPAPQAQIDGTVLSASAAVKKEPFQVEFRATDALVQRLLEKAGPSARVTPDAEGRFKLRAPPGVSLSVVETKGLRSQVRAGPGGRVTIVRNAPVVYTIEVADAASKPVVGAWILLRTLMIDGPRNDVARTDASGAATFEFDLPLTDLSSPEVLLYHPSHGSVRAALKHDERRWTPSFVPQEPAPVGGKLVDDAAGKPVEGVKVGLACEIFGSDAIAETTSDKDGRFAFAFAPELAGAEDQTRIYAVLEGVVPPRVELKRTAGQIIKVRR